LGFSEEVKPPLFRERSTIQPPIAVQNQKKSRGKKSQADKSVLGLHPSYWAEDFPLEPIYEHERNYSEVEPNDYLELEI
jgi:hypothetical protein